MSFIYRKNKDGSLKDWVVTVRRQNIIYRKYFPVDKEKEAKEYHEYLLLTLPSINRLGPGKGIKVRVVGNRQPFKRNGCILYAAPLGIRCALSNSCKYFSDCLNEAAKRDWPGFKTKGDKRCAQLVV